MLGSHNATYTSFAPETKCKFHFKYIKVRSIGPMEYIPYTSLRTTNLLISSNIEAGMRTKEVWQPLIVLNVNCMDITC